MFLWFFCIDMVLVQVIYILCQSLSLGLIYERFKLILQIYVVC